MGTKKIIIGCFLTLFSTFLLNAYTSLIDSDTQTNINLLASAIQPKSAEEEVESTSKKNLTRMDSIKNARKKRIEERKQRSTGSIGFDKSNNEIIDGHQAVDLGLSVKWATCNVGANSPEKRGHFFAWGETSTKEKYEGNPKILYEGRNISLGDISGTEYDAAQKIWGGSWRMPNLDECKELIEKCKWEWKTVNGQTGYKVIGPNGNSIFLPALGYVDGASLEDKGKLGMYWSSTRRIADELESFGLQFINDPQYPRQQVIGKISRYPGLAVRPVVGEGIKDDSSFIKKISGTKNGHDYVDLGLSVKWATSNIGASQPQDYGEYYSRGEGRKKPKNYFTQGNYTLETVNLIKEVGGDLTGSQYDVATKKWGEGWRTPTVKEAQELIDKCKWEPVCIKGHYGVKVTGPNGNSIFLPSSAQGPTMPGVNWAIENVGFYWTTGQGEGYWEGIALQSNSLSDERSLIGKRSFMGLTIRPVTN